MKEPTTWLVPREQEGNIGYIAQHIKAVVRLKTEVETEVGVSGVQNAPWFIKKHLEVVEDEANWILENCRGAKGIDRDEVLIAVWTHDLGRVMGWRDLHHAASALKTKQWLLDNGLGEDVAMRIFNANLRHGAEGELQPVTTLDKVIATADALSHFDGCESGSVQGFLERKGFWYWMLGYRIKEGLDDEKILKWFLKKIERDATSKQGFEESKERAKKESEFLKTHASKILQRIREEIQL